MTLATDQDIAIKVTNCSMGCLYSTQQPIDKCLCKCKGEHHGLMAGQMQAPARCSPAAEKRCKSGTEGTVCTCACKGRNHAIYAGIPHYKVTISKV